MASGFNSRAAFVREADIYTPTWPSATAAVATQLLPLLSESVGSIVNQAGIVTVDGKVHPPRITDRTVSGNLSVEARYQGLEFFLAASLGFMAKRIDGATMPEDMGGGVYRHLFEIDPVLAQQTWLAGEGWQAGDGLIANQKKLRRGTYVVDKDIAVWEAKSCMLDGFQFQANGAACTFTTNVLGYEFSYSSEVGNDLSTLPINRDRVLFHDGLFYLGESTPLSVIPDIVGFSTNYQANLSTLRTIHTKTQIAEPKRTGPALISGSFAFPFYTTIGPQLQAWVENGTDLKGCMEFVFGDFVLRFWYPSLRLTSFDVAISGPEQVQQNYTFVASTAEDPPDGFPSNVKNGPMMVELLNGVDTHALID